MCVALSLFFFGFFRVWVDEGTYSDYQVTTQKRSIVEFSHFFFFFFLGEMGLIMRELGKAKAEMLTISDTRASSQVAYFFPSCIEMKYHQIEEKKKTA